MVNQPKNIVLFVGNIFESHIEAIRSYDSSLRVGFLYDSKTKLAPKTKKRLKKIDVVLKCDISSPVALSKALKPYENQIFSVTARGEYHIPTLSKIIPHVPYLKTPTAASLLWATDKLMMRRKLYTYNKKISPKYTLVSDTSEKSLEKIEEKIGFPLIAKPTGLAASQLVSICYHKEELEKVLKNIFKNIKRISKKKGAQNQQILVEQFMEGDMYSVDGYVTNRGKLYFCPMVHVKTGNTIGFDDFFGYRQMTPTLLKTTSIKQAHAVAKEAVHALGLRSTTVHVELIRMEGGWKVIELSPRMGGFRHSLYEFSFGINHTINDILIHAGKKPITPHRRKGYTVAMKFFAKKEGILTELKGLKKARALESFKSLNIKNKIGDKCLYAKNGGSSIFNIIMFNKDRSKLLADIRRLEQMIIIKTSKKII